MPLTPALFQLQPGHGGCLQWSRSPPLLLLLLLRTGMFMYLLRSQLSVCARQACWGALMPEVCRAEHRLLLCEFAALEGH